MDDTFIPRDGTFPIRLKWSHHVSAQPEIGAFFEDYIFIKENNTALRAVNIHTGSYEWSNDFASQIKDIKVLGRYINVITSNGKFYKIHPEKGSITKAVSIEDSIISNAIILEQNMVLYSTANNMSVTASLSTNTTLTEHPYQIEKIFSSDPPLFQSNNKLYTLDSNGKSWIQLAEDSSNIITAKTNGNYTAILAQNEVTLVNNNELTKPYKLSLTQVYDSFEATFHNGDLFILGKRENNVDLLSFPVDEPHSNPISTIVPITTLNTGDYNSNMLVTDDVIVITYANEMVLLDADAPSVIRSLFSLPSTINSKPALYNSLLFIPSAGLINCYRGRNNIPSQVTLSYFYKDEPVPDGTEAIVITWESPEEIGITRHHYDIQYTTGELKNISDVDPVNVGDKNSYIIENFESGFLQWRLRLNINGIYSPWSNTNLYLLPEGRHFNTPNPPEFINAIPSQNSSIILEFRPFDERSTYYYNIYYKKTSESWSDSTLLTRIEKSPFVIPRLDQFRGYEFGITSVDFYGNESIMNITTTVPIPKITLNDRRGDRTLDKTIKKSNNGDSITLATGHYFEHVVIDKSISITGSSPKDTQLITYLNDPLVEIKAPAGSTVTMENLALIIEGNHSAAIKITSGNLIIKNLLIVGNNNSIAIEIANPESKARISHATIINNNTVFRLSNSDNIEVSNSILSNNTRVTDGESLKRSEYNSITLGNPLETHLNLSGNPTPIFLQPARRLNYLVASESKTINAGVLNKAGKTFSTNLGAYGETPYAATLENNDLHKYIYIEGITHVSSFTVSQKAPGIDRINCYIMTPSATKSDLIKTYELNESVIKITLPGRIFGLNYRLTAPALSSYINAGADSPIGLITSFGTTFGRLLVYMIICAMATLILRTKAS